MAIPAEIVARLRENDPTLIELNLTEQIESNEDIEKLVESLAKNTCLQMLRIHGSASRKFKLNNRSAELLSQCTGLIELDLSGNCSITDVGIAFFGYTPLRRLVAPVCGITEEAYPHFFDNQSLEQLNVWRLNMSSAYEGRIGAMINRNGLFHKMNALLASVLQKNPACIESLPESLHISAKEYQHNHFGSHGDTRTLVNNLSKLPELTHNLTLKEAKECAERYREFSEPDPYKKRKVDPEPESSSSASLSPSL